MEQLFLLVRIDLSYQKRNTKKVEDEEYLKNNNFPHVTCLKENFIHNFYEEVCNKIADIQSQVKYIPRKCRN